MSKIFARLKKRGAEKHQPSVSPSPQPSEEKTESVTKSPPPFLPSSVELESPKHAVETDSIFKGLKLSAQVAHSERSDSPYLQKSQGDDGVDDDDDDGNGGSQFSFLHDHQSKDEEGGGDIESDKSDDGQTSSSFAFINSSTSLQEPHPQDPKEAAVATDTGSESEPLKAEPTKTKEAVSPPPQSTQAKLSPLEPTLLLTREREVKSSSPQRTGGGRSAGRQLPPTATNKKKKKKAIRPGQQQTTASQVDGDVPSINTSQEKESESKDVVSLEVERPALISNPKEEVDPSISRSDDTSTSAAPEKSSSEHSLENQDNEEQLSVDEVTCTMETKQMSTETQSEPVGVVREEVGVVSTATEESVSQPVAMETVDESDALEEVFGNYHIELSGEEKLSALLQSYQSGIRKIRDGEGAEQNHTQVIEHELSSVELLIKQRSEVQKLRTEEAKALTDEDYELAEQLSKKLEQIDLVSEWNIAETGLNAIKGWMKQCAELSENERELRMSTQEQLTTLKEEQSKALQEINKQLASLKNKEKMRVQALQDKIDRERGHIALDREHLERNEAKLKEEVENRAAQPISAKLKLEEKLSDVEEEIVSLEAKLTELKKERDKLKQDIETEEMTIAAVKEELSVEQLQLDKERQQIELRDSELSKEEEKLAEEHHSMAATLMEEENKRDSLAKVIDSAGLKCAELAGVGETVEELLSQLQPLVDNCRSQLKPSEHIKRLHKQFTGLASQVEKMSGVVLATQLKLTSLTKKISDDEIQLQQLTDAKQAAITGRQFKEAGRLAAESKAVQARLDEERSEVRDTSSQLDELNCQLSELSEKSSAAREEVEREEKTEDEEHIERLGRWSQQLRERSKQVQGTALQEVLEKWCQLNRLLRESLSTKHGLTLLVEEDAASHQSAEEKDLPTEERTPGVGSEEGGSVVNQEEEVSACDKKTEMAEEREEEKEELCQKMASIEAELEKACQEENFDRAAELDEQLETVKKLLEQS